MNVPAASCRYVQPVRLGPETLVEIVDLSDYANEPPYGTKLASLWAKRRLDSGRSLPASYAVGGPCTVDDSEPELSFEPSSNHLPRHPPYVQP